MGPYKLSDCIVMMTKEGSTIIVNFITPGAEVLVQGQGHIKCIISLKNLLPYSKVQNRQTKYLVMMTKEGFTKIMNSMTPGAGVLVLGHDQR